MAGPMWHHEGKFTMAALPGKLLGPFFFLLHWVEEISRMISISFRLFGNIMGAAIVLTVVSTLSYGLVIPMGLYAFLFIFEAAVQGFVFAMLTLMYIASAVQHEA
jgi:F-type H+-transporting ATPase subunit a